MANSDWYSPNLSGVNNVDESTSPEPNHPELHPSYPDDDGEFFDATNCSLLPVFGTQSHGAVEPLTATACGLYLMFGVLCLLFGYRCFKAVMFFTGFVFASVVVYLICLEENILPTWSNVAIAASAGILFGLITLLVQYVGLFMLGFHSGLLIAVIGLCVADSWVKPNSPWTSVGILLLSGLALALMNLCFQKALTILGSALYGSAILMTCLDYFLENSLMLKWVWDKVRVQQSVEPCWFSWIILAVWPGAMLTGIVTQVLCTGRGIYHEKQFPPLNRHPRSRSRHPPETKEERKQRKYRYLYQVRTCHGDVISQPIPGKHVQHLNETYSA